jgi:hypothetical protein
MRKRLGLTHQQISWAKSAVRIIGYTIYCFVAPHMMMAGIVFIAAELIGVYEEIDR